MRLSRPLLPALVAGLLAACASDGLHGLKVGESRLDDIERVMGPAAMRWPAADGSLQLAYPRGPTGYDTYMAQVGSDGRLNRIENVLDWRGFARVQPGMSKDDVLRALGPSDPYGTAYFAARDELVWDWRYCDDWNEPAHFYVLFDASAGRVRSTMSLTESQIGYGDKWRSYCGH